MGSFQLQWISGDKVRETDKALEVRQVYVWCITSDGKFIIVSKDGHNWQLPGGKPEPGESTVETAVREVREETGLTLIPYDNDLQFFGYYVVSKTDENGGEQKFLQLRLWMKMTEHSGALQLSAREENRDQDESEQVRFAKVVSPVEATSPIPWLESSGECQRLMELGIIS